MLQRKSQRAAAGKATRFTLRGRDVQWDHVERYVKRHKASLQNAKDTPPALEALRCYTPPPQVTRQLFPPLHGSASELAWSSILLTITTIPNDPPTKFIQPSTDKPSFQYLKLKWSVHKVLQHLESGVKSKANRDWNQLTACLETSLAHVNELAVCRSIGSVFAMIHSYKLLREADMTCAATSLLRSSIASMSSESGQPLHGPLCLALYSLDDKQLDGLRSFLLDKLEHLLHDFVCDFMLRVVEFSPASHDADGQSPPYPPRPQYELNTCEL